MLAEPASSKGMSQSGFDKRTNDLHMNDREWLEIADQNANVLNILGVGRVMEEGYQGPPLVQLLESSTTPLWGSGETEVESVRGSRESPSYYAFPLMCSICSSEW